MRKLLFLMLLFSGALLSSCTAPSGKTPPEPFYRQISTDEAAELMQTEKNYILLDVRTPEEFAERHIPGAINIPNETIGSEAPEALKNKAQLILVYCRSGRRSKEAAEKLALLGYTNIAEFGGINDWKGETVQGK